AELPQDCACEAVPLDVALGEGRARLSPLRAELAHVALSGTGSAQLDNLDFSADFEAQLDPSLSEVDPACRVNERYTAIGWPVACKGNLGADPGQWCSVDSGKIVKTLAANEARRKVEEKAGELFTKLLNKKDK
ncbi:MAG: AsmA family protein, partial [Parahaliea sp.]